MFQNLVFSSIPQIKETIEDFKLQVLVWTKLGFTTSLFWSLNNCYDYAGTDCV